MKFGKYIKDNKIVVIIWIMFFVITFSIFSVFRIKFEAIVMYAALCVMFIGTFSEKRITMMNL